MINDNNTNILLLNYDSEELDDKRSIQTNHQNVVKMFHILMNLLYE